MNQQANVAKRGAVTRGAAARKVKDAAVKKTTTGRAPLGNKSAAVNAPTGGGAAVPGKKTAKATAVVSRKRAAVDDVKKMQEGENEMPAPTRVSGKAKMARAATQPVKAVTRKAVATSKPLPDIESIKKANPTVDVLEGQAEAGPVAKKSRFEGWEDLDKDDDMDPLMVNEYVVEIFDYMKELEYETKPDPDYMSNQAELKWKMRAILVDWLVDVHTKFRLLPETLYLAINLIDRFLSLRVVSCAKLQLVGVAAMFIASKYEEICHPTIANFIFLADGGYTEEEVLKAERYLLQVLNFGLQYPNPMNFLRRCSKAENYNLQTRTLAKYLMEITLMDQRFLPYVPSIVAAAGLYLARKMLVTGEWDMNLSHYSSYSEDELLPVVELMVDYLSKPLQFESIYNKYCTKRFMKSAIFVDNWVKKQNANKETRLFKQIEFEDRSSEFEEDSDEDREEESEEEDQY